MHDVQYLIDRQLGFGGQFNYDNILRRLIVRSDESYYGLQSGYVDPGFEQDPPIFACKFAEASGYEHILALANEDGRVALQDTSKLGGGLEGFQCHNNAVFDLVWLPGELKFVTVSGDHTAALWDCGSGEPRQIRVLAGHTRSLRTAAVCREQAAGLLATGARDGLILLWDTRSSSPVTRLAGCHAPRAATPPRRASPRAPRAGSITALVFGEAHELMSAGESDGNVKLWDLRRSYRAPRAPLPARSLPYPGVSARCGYTHLLRDARRHALYAGCMDGVIYCFNMHTGSLEQRYRGHESGTFYVRAALSPDGSHLVSGSSDRCAYVWRVAGARPASGAPPASGARPVLRLAGHRAEVTCAAWRADSGAPPAVLVTCGDDARHKLWRVGSEVHADRQELRGWTEDVPAEAVVSPPPVARTPRSAGRPRPAGAQRCLLQLLNQTTPTSKRRASTEERTSDRKRRCDEETWGALPSGAITSPSRERTPERSAPAQTIPVNSPVTSRLPDFVLNGEAPHLRLMSPIRRRPEPDNWLARLGRERRAPAPPQALAPAPPQAPAPPTTPPTRRPSTADRTPRSSDRGGPRSADRPSKPPRPGRTLLKYFTVTTKTEDILE